MQQKPSMWFSLLLSNITTCTLGIWRSKVTLETRISFLLISMNSRISNIPVVLNTSSYFILLPAARISLNECWIQCRLSNMTSLLWVKRRLSSFLYLSKIFLLKFDTLFSANNNFSIQHFNVHSSGGVCNLFSSKFRVNILWRLQNPPTSICSKPIAVNPISCNIK